MGPFRSSRDRIPEGEASAPHLNPLLASAIKYKNSSYQCEAQDDPIAFKILWCSVCFMKFVKKKLMFFFRLRFFENYTSTGKKKSKSTFCQKQNKQDCSYQGEALNVPTAF